MSKSDVVNDVVDETDTLDEATDDGEEIEEADAELIDGDEAEAEAEAPPDKDDKSKLPVYTHRTKFGGIKADPITDEVRYPEVSIKLRIGEDAVGHEEMMGILGWQTEEEWIALMKEADEQKALTSKKKSDGKEKEKVVYSFGDDYLFQTPKNLGNQKIRCMFNTRNRPFNYKWAQQLAWEILKGHWAGPNGTGKTINGETFNIGMYGQVLSGQHRGIALVLAGLEYAVNPDKYPHWKDKGISPVLDLAIFTGIDESQDTLQTLDNVMPRSLSDTIFTSPIFSKMRRPDRLECSRMLGAAVQFLWKRTGTAGVVKFQTPAEAADFIERHATLLECVYQMFLFNGGEGSGTGRAITNNIGLSAGVCSALFYLFAASEANQEEYSDCRSEKCVPTVGKGKNKEFSQYEKARGFFVELSTVKHNPALRVVTECLGRIVEDTEFDAVRIVEKVSILIKAWNLYVNDEPITADDLDLAEHYVQKEDSDQVLFIDPPIIGGLDFGEPKKKEADSEANNPSAEEVAKQAEQAKLAAQAEIEANAAKAKATTPPAEDLKAEAARIAEQRRKTYDDKREAERKAAEEQDKKEGKTAKGKGGPKLRGGTN